MGDLSSCEYLRRWWISRGFVVSENRVKIGKIRKSGKSENRRILGNRGNRGILGNRENQKIRKSMTSSKNQKISKISENR